MFHANVIQRQMNALSMKRMKKRLQAILPRGAVILAEVILAAGTLVEVKPERAEPEAVNRLRMMCLNPRYFPKLR